MQHAFATKDLRFEPAIDPAAGSISGDGHRLQQVIWNLLSNAVKFTPRGGRIDVRLRHADGEAEIAVTDTGKGIDPRFLSVAGDSAGGGLALALVMALRDAGEKLPSCVACLSPWK